MPAAAPRPPFLPKDLADFANHLTAHPEEWFEYCKKADRYILKAEPAQLLLENSKKALQIQSLQKENEHLHDETLRLRNKISNQDAIIEYQKQLAKEKDLELIKTTRESHQTTESTTPTASTPAQSYEHPIEVSLPKPQPIHQLSECLPDPDRFEGDRKDVRRFISQIQEKMNVNRDHFPTPQSRMTYVHNRLKGEPYAQIIPYIKKGICQLNDYEDILDKLDQAFGDPNRVHNACNELFRLRQNNKEFGSFFAEFHRLALEGEMSEETLPTLLEQSINRELKGMLMHNQPPTREYHGFAKFLQELENRRRYYESNLQPVNRSYRPTTKPVISQVTLNPSYSPRPAGSPMTAQPPAYNTDAMDLSSARRYSSTRRERGECFRCGSKEHMIKNCPHPDNRPFEIRSAYATSSISAGSGSTAVSEGLRSQGGQGRLLITKKEKLVIGSCTNLLIN